MLSYSLFVNEKIDPHRPKFESIFKILHTRRCKFISMITISAKNFKNFIVINYNNLIDNLPIHNLTCTCGAKGNLIKHGSYKRKIKEPSGKTVITIQRVKCNSCGITHAILPEWIIPYSSVILSDQIKIISAYLAGDDISSVMNENPEIDESNIKYTINQFVSHWKERLKSFKISFDINLIKNCFNYFSRNFMQIKWTPNILFS